MKVYVVISETWDECSLCNRVFLTYEKAWDYAKKSEKETGCTLRVVGMELVE